jgi:dihydroorotate dehydrogenase
LEHGGFSGPHLFDRTVALVKRYKKLLDRRPSTAIQGELSRPELESQAREIEESLKADEKIHKASTETTSSNPSNVMESSVDMGTIDFRPPPDNEQSDSEEALLNSSKDRLLDRSSKERERLRSIKDAIEQLPTRQEKTTTLDHPKVIFASGGITNGRQALEVLNAGASVAMVYTALVYGGVGTISRIKNEMREEMKAAKKVTNEAKKIAQS